MVLAAGGELHGFILMSGSRWPSCTSRELGRELHAEQHHTHSSPTRIGSVCSGWRLLPFPGSWQHYGVAWEHPSFHVLMIRDWAPELIRIIKHAFFIHRNSSSSGVPQLDQRRKKIYLRMCHQPLSQRIFLSDFFVHVVSSWRFCCLYSSLQLHSFDSFRRIDIHHQLVRVIWSGKGTFRSIDVPRIGGGAASIPNFDIEGFMIASCRLQECTINLRGSHHLLYMYQRGSFSTGHLIHDK